MNPVVKKNRLTILAGLFIFIFSFSSCEKDVSTSPVEAEPPQGFVFVDSSPEKFKIYLDGKFTGRFTPDTIPYIEENEHSIGLKKKYWLDSSMMVAADRNELKSINIDFMQNPKVFGSLELLSDPGDADIFLNDSLVEMKTPGIISGLIPGVYTVEFRKSEHRSRSARRVVESSKITKITLALQDTSVWVDFTKRNSDLPNDIITSVRIDNENRVWAGTVNSGIVSLKGTKWSFYNRGNSGLPSDSINVIEIDKNNTLWIGTAKGLAEFKDGTVINIYNKSNSPLITEVIQSIAFQGDNTILAGTSGGLLKIDNGNMGLFPTEENPHKLPRSVGAVEPESDNVAWLGMGGKLVLMDNDQYFTNPRDMSFAGFPNTNVSTIMIRPADGKLWVLLSGDNEENTHIFPPTQGQKSYFTVWNGTDWYAQQIGGNGTVLHEAVADRDNYVWIASNVGLLRYETIRIGKVYREDNSGLFNNDIRSIAEDHNGALWVGSGEGLIKYKKNLLP